MRRKLISNFNFILNPSLTLHIAKPELRTLEWETFNPDCLIRISNVDTFDFLLNPLFFGHSTENSKTDFSKFRESLPFLYINLKWRAKIQISRLLILDSLVGCFYTLKIKKKRGSSINLDIHHSKVTSSDRLDLGLHLLQYYCTMYFSS